jgi:polyisoprenoid-binding protein YceI
MVWVCSTVTLPTRTVHLERNHAMSTPTVPAILPGTWSVDPTHTHIGFSVRHLMVSKVRGSFGDFTAEVTIAENLLESTLSAVVQMASIVTGNDDRDGHLRTNDFFAIEEHPTMSLVSTGFEARGGDDYVMHADLTIRGITKPVDFEIEFGGIGGDPWGGTRAGFEAKATINRKDWGIAWNAPVETGGVVIGEKVDIQLEVELVKS